MAHKEYKGHKEKRVTLASKALRESKDSKAHKERRAMMPSIGNSRHLPSPIPWIARAM